MFSLIFVHPNGDESAWYVPVRSIVEACRIANDYGFEDEYFHVVNINDKLVFSGKVEKKSGIYCRG